MNKKVIIMLLLALLSFPLLSQAAPAGKFTHIEGNVDVTAPGREAAAAKPGDVLNLGDIIRTKSKARCEVAFPDGSTVRLAENSRLRLSESNLDQGKQTVVLYLFRGRSHNTVATGAGKSRYEVHTPAAIYRAAGTEFFISHLSGTSTAVVTKGRINGSSANKPEDSRPIVAGQAMVNADPDAPPMVRMATVAETEQNHNATARSGGPGQEPPGREHTETLALAANLEPAEAGLAPLLAPAPPAPPAVPQTPLVPVTQADGTPPLITISGLPASPNNNNNADFVVTTDEPATLGFALNGTPVASPNLTNLPEGPNTFTVRATDTAGNTSVKEYTWTTDYTPPIINLAGAPPPQSTNMAAPVNLGTTSNEPVTYSYTLDGVATTKTSFTKADLAVEKTYTWEVTATDQAGNKTTKTYSWTTDYTPPEVAVLPLSAGTGGQGHVTVTLTSKNEPASFSSTLDGTVDFTGTTLDLTALAPGDHVLIVEATDAAGNKKQTTFNFALTNNYAVGGDLAGSGFSGLVTGNAAIISGQPWSGLNLGLAGTAGTLPGSNWQAPAGGLLQNTLGYWVADLNGGAWTNGGIAGSLNYRYLTPEALGVSAGPLAGSYLWNPATSVYDWQAAAGGGLTETPLALGAAVTASYHYYDNGWGEITSSFGYLEGLLGTTASPFASATAFNAPGTPVGLLVMGQAAPEGGSAWWGDIFQPYLPGGGALPLGLIGGRTTSHYDYATGAYTGWQEEQEGLLLGLYIDENGNGGLLEGFFAGDFYPRAGGLFVADGSLLATRKAAGFDPATTVYNFNPLAGAYSGRLADGGSLAAAAAGGIQESSWGYLGSYSYWLEKNGVPEPWGIFNLELGGEYTAGATAPQSWELYLGGTALRGLEAPEYWLAGTTAGAWTATDGDKRLAADLTGWYMTPTTLGTLNGRILGSYDTNGVPGNWEAIALGAFEDTQPLEFSAELYAGYHTTMDNGGLWEVTEDLAANLTGLMGTTVSPFTSATGLGVPGDSVDLYLLGEAWPADRTIWWGNLSGATGIDGAIIPDGFIAGLTASTLAARENMQGLLAALYIDQAGNAGILEGDFSGLYYPLGNGSGIFEANPATNYSALWATKKAEGYTSYDEGTNLGYNYFDGAFAGSFLDGNNLPAGAINAAGAIADISWGRTGSYTTWLQQTVDTPEPWGIFIMELGGNYTGTPSDTWTMQLGGPSWRALDSKEYWLAEIYGTQWSDQQITGGLQGTYLSTRVLGTMTGYLLGSSDPASWTAVTAGTFEEQTLAFISDLASDDGIVSALMGGTNSLWTNTAVPATMIGAWDGTSGIWSLPVWIDNFFLDGSYNTYADGYRGFGSLLTNGEQGLDVDLIALYADPDGKAGYLKGDLLGAAYPALRLFSAEGAIVKTEIEQAPAGVTAANFDVTESGPQALTLAGLPADPAFLSETRNAAWITGVTSWGIWQGVLEGNGTTAPAAWQWETARGTDASYWTSYYDVAWANNASNQLAGDVAGAQADWINAATYVLGGEIKGLFDPATASWKAVSQGAWMETGKFLEMAANNPAALQAMNIPAIQVGSATLSQAAGTTLNNLSDVSMNNVRFFATSTGSVPKIWATNAVTGNYGAAPVVGGTPVPLAGGGLNANFEVRNWNTAAGTWGANITGGTGTLSGGSYNGPVQFQGGAAGQIGTGSFSGTGAGVAK